jgi:predicted nucleotidyltransferase
VTSTEYVLRPSEAAIAAALDRLLVEGRRLYGERLLAAYLVGSRARGDHRPDSDVDVVFVLPDDGWDLRAERRKLSSVSYDLLVDDGVDVQTIPVRVTEWSEPERHRNPSLIRSMRRDARPLRAAS